MRSIGIDIGRKNLKILEVEKAGASFKITAFYKKELPAGWERDDLEAPVKRLLSSRL
jgi:Tfp pilus assembly PilM family ATPase